MSEGYLIKRRWGKVLQQAVLDLAPPRIPFMSPRQRGPFSFVTNHTFNMDEIKQLKAVLVTVDYVEQSVEANDFATLASANAAQTPIINMKGGIKTSQNYNEFGGKRTNAIIPQGGGVWHECSLESFPADKL